MYASANVPLVGVGRMELSAIIQFFGTCVEKPDHSNKTVRLSVDSDCVHGSEQAESTKTRIHIITLNIGFKWGIEDEHRAQGDRTQIIDKE
jgi:hypothetical protein